MKKILLLIALMAVMLLTTGCFRIIESGEVGVKKTLGKIDDNEIGDGLRFFVPIVQFIEVHNIKTQEIKETAEVPSSEGLIVRLDISTIYHLNPEKAAEIRKTVTGKYWDTLLVPFARSSIRDIVSGYEAKSIYSDEGRQEVAIKVKENLRKNLEPRGIIIEDVLLRDVKLPDKVTEAIQLKLEKEQEVQRKGFELQSATIDAEIKIVEAGGIAQANEIIAGSLTAEYLTFKFIQTLGETENQVIYVPVEAGTPVLTRQTS